MPICLLFGGRFDRFSSVILQFIESCDVNKLICGKAQCTHHVMHFQSDKILAITNRASV